MFNESELYQFLNKWQKILRLNDWNIKLELVTKDWRKTGDVRIDQCDKTAIILINNYNPKQTNIETVIIHELLHIKLWGMDQMIESLLHCVYGDDEKDSKFTFAYAQFMELLEVTTQDLTRGEKMDKLSFKRKTSKTDPNIVGVDHEYILAETIINYRPFFDYLEENHEYDYNIAKRLYLELIGETEASEIYTSLGNNNAVLLICSVCFHEGDNPLIFTFEETDTAVIWSDFYTNPIEKNYSEIPVFRFDKEQYKAALVQLKEIAAEGYRIK